MAYLTKYSNITVTNNANLGLPDKITIAGGTARSMLSTDGTGNLYWGDGGTVNLINTTGSGLGFSLSGGPITTAGTIALTAPTEAELRGTLNIGTVANVNFTSDSTQLLAGDGTWRSEGTLSVDHANTADTATSASQLITSGGFSNFTIVQTGDRLEFLYAGVPIASLDGSGNFVTAQNITAFGTP